MGMINGVNGLFKIFDVKDSDVKDKEYDGVKRDIYKAKKELVAEKVLVHNNLWNYFFPGARAIKITDRAVQLSGIDFVIDGKNVDLKGEIGDYTDTIIGIGDTSIICVELFQNGKRTFTKDKKTDYVLYLNINVNSYAIDAMYYAILVPYDLILQIVDDNINNNYFSKYYTRDRSNSKSYSSGEYIRLPAKLIEDKCKVIPLTSLFTSTEKMKLTIG